MEFLASSYSHHNIGLNNLKTEGFCLFHCLSNKSILQRGERREKGRCTGRDGRKVRRVRGKAEGGRRRDIEIWREGDWGRGTVGEEGRGEAERGRQEEGLEEERVLTQVKGEEKDKPMNREGERAGKAGLWRKGLWKRWVETI